MGKKGNGNDLLHSSEVFADEVLALCRRLKKQGTERELVSQLLKAGTSVGANVSEAQQAQSGDDFVSKLEIASKECRESEQWFGLLYRAGDIPRTEYTHFRNQWIHIQCLIAASAKTAKRNMEEAKQRKKEARKKQKKKQKTDTTEDDSAVDENK